jgi:hypothetical protein
MILTTGMRRQNGTGTPAHNRKFRREKFRPMPMPQHGPDHISDHDLECYYLGTVTDEEELAPLEEHPLLPIVC